MDLGGRDVLVVGVARSGAAAARFLVQRGARVVATDRKNSEELGAEPLSLAQEGVRLELGGHRAETFAAASMIVVSPGVPWDLPELSAARRAGIPVMAEMELGYRHLQGTLAAVTGTKGKSTTTAALGAMLREEMSDVRVGGNIGTALTGLLDGATADTRFVVETSSFQLEGTDTFHPQVAVFLNLHHDHLDRHRTFEAYAEAKARIFRNQTAADWAVVNADDPAVLAMASRHHARLLPFGDASRPGDAAFFEGGEARLRIEGRTEALFPRAAVRLPGAHLAEDLLAAAAAARLLGASSAAVSRAVSGFSGLEHVLEHVATLEGVSYFNDSKATDILATRRSLESFAGPLLLILGGVYKGGDFAELGDLLAERGKRVVAIGEATERIVRALTPFVQVERSASLQEAVERCHAVAVAGDTVLLAPACSSFDMFRDYAERGRAFKAAVRRLAGGAQSQPKEASHG